MSDKQPSINLKSLAPKLSELGHRLRPYRLFAFLLFIVLLYGFLLLRIDSLMNAQPSEDAVTSQIQAAKLPHVDQSVIERLRSLRNNSVNVQSLFNKARSNPFQSKP